MAYLTMLSLRVDQPTHDRIKAVAQAQHIAVYKWLQQAVIKQLERDEEKQA